jgi:transketolase
MNNIISNNSKQEKIVIKSKNIRKKILQMAMEAGSSSAHIGGALSIADILSILFFHVMTIDKNDPLSDKRDRFILSKGHACLAYYASLSELGYISDKELKTFEKNDTNLPGHPVINKKLGIEFSTGSLGMGLSLGIGVALSAIKKKSIYNVFVVLGDGECNEGSVWEAAMAAPNLNVNNLNVIIDRNNFQQTGTNAEIMDLRDLKKKWESFGWHVVELDGHDINLLIKTFTNIKKINQPKVIIANTIKGKGFSKFENDNKWHHSILTKSFYEEAIKEIDNS